MLLLIKEMGLLFLIIKRASLGKGLLPLYLLEIHLCVKGQTNILLAHLLEVKREKKNRD